MVILDGISVIMLDGSVVEPLNDNPKNEGSIPAAASTGIEKKQIILVILGSIHICLFYDDYDSCCTQ
jgi:hypothetical protein